ncbi:unnamed protein product [Camellia sinensis]
MQNPRRNQSPSSDPNPQSRFVGQSDAFSNLFLDDAFSQLGLSSSSSSSAAVSRGQPSLFPASLDDPESYYSIVNEGLSSLSFQSNDELERLMMLQKVGNGGDMGFGGTHRNLTAATGSYRTAAREPWRTDDGVNSLSWFSRENNGFFLQRKKQLGKLLNSQFPILPCSNRPSFFTDFDQRFDGYASDSSSVLMPNLYTQISHQSPQYLDYLSSEDLRRHVITLAKDQHGCRLLQKKFEDPKEEEIEALLSEVIDHVGELMRDQFGNYLIQKLVKVCNEKQRTRIILSVTKSQFQLISICLSPHGTRAAQRLLEHITSQQQISLVISALCPGAVALATDPNGYHVIQHCLANFSTEDNKRSCNMILSSAESWKVGLLAEYSSQCSLESVQALVFPYSIRSLREFGFCSMSYLKTALSLQYLLKVMADNCFEIATNKSGCCVMQSSVENSQGEYRERLVSEIIANAPHLAEDQFGNYVVQQLLGLKIPEVTTNLLRQLEGTYVSLSRNKYASNVVEKCLAESGEEQSSRIIMELLRNPNVCMLLVDPFGNFVIQSALSVSKGVIRNALVNLVRMNAPSMRTNLYGKKVLSWFNKMKLQHLVERSSFETFSTPLG